MMFVKAMVTDLWLDFDCEDSVRERPAPSDIAAAIRALDARVKTIVILEADGEHHMAVGGGNGQYVVYWTRDNDVFFNLLGDASAEGEVFLFIGGQEGNYPARQIVGLERAISAGVAFAQTGGLDAPQDWEEQG